MNEYEFQFLIVKRFGEEETGRTVQAQSILGEVESLGSWDAGARVCRLAPTRASAAPSARLVSHRWTAGAALRACEPTLSTQTSACRSDAVSDDLKQRS